MGQFFDQPQEMVKKLLTDGWKNFTLPTPKVSEMDPSGQLWKGLTIFGEALKILRIRMQKGKWEKPVVANVSKKTDAELAREDPRIRSVFNPSDLNRSNDAEAEGSMAKAFNRTEAEAAANNKSHKNNTNHTNATSDATQNEEEEEREQGSFAYKLEMLSRVWARDLLFNTTSKCLSFHHIPSTVTGLEYTPATKHSKTYWIPRDELFDLCRHQVSREEKTSLSYCEFNDGGAKCNAWHVPPFYEPLIRDREKQCDTFCVVRHPATRFRSHYRHQGGWNRPCDVDSFTQFTKDELSKASVRPYRSDCHFVPQVEYVYGPGLHPKNPGDNPRRYCTHVLQYEDLKNQFDALLARYGIPGVLKTPAYARDVDNMKCDIPISAEVQALIAKHFADDYKVFGYSTELDERLQYEY
eukprot:gnl/TRDRNA2_/TRDRNA2_153589_c2_seq2.p1 gnl/TRDRNA2_/TRDRNA2_153589_c2~~gnl/TRDRNA2_/TRDRNA2_153589_c2_seq2.p1  ORF type:complete len:411 (-),score=46.72 gnl/TRDRNA2_/TRDRNA2_153589_c2_seq2:91-1323(-)